MSLPKVLNEIKQDLDAIKAKLGIVDGEAPMLAAPPEPEPETPEQVAARLDYDTYSAKEIIERADSLTLEERRALAQYERANEDRTTVIAALEGGKTA